jgi:hypothetical protein
MPGDVFLVNLNSTCFTLDLLIETGTEKMRLLMQAQIFLGSEDSNWITTTENELFLFVFSFPPDLVLAIIK